MSVGSVTARSSGMSAARFMATLPTGTRTVAPKLFTGFRGTTAGFQAIGGTAGNLTAKQFNQLMRTGVTGPVVKTAVSRRALAKLALKIIGKRAGGVIGEVVREAGGLFYRRVLVPTGFPGWGNFPDGWTSDPGTPFPGASPGDYTANGFDNGPYSVTVHNLIDTSDGSPIGGFRYWGHFHASNPLPRGRPADDWQLETDLMPESKPKPLTTAQARVRYRQHSEPRVQPRAAPWHPRRNFAITVGNREPDGFSIANDVPRVRDRGDKVLPKNVFVYFVLKKFANSGGEAKEWIDIFAEATGYIKGSKMLPDHLRDTGKETQAKMYWLFVITGLNSLDWELLGDLVRYNTLEDIAFGFAGQLSKSAARSLGLTVGPQTGLVM